MNSLSTSSKKVPKAKRADKLERQVIALRISDLTLYNKIEKLSKEQKISLNMAVNMLLGFAFNEVERQNKKFIPKVVFESK